MRHGAFSNLIFWHLRHPRLATGRRTLLFAALGFDVFFQEVFSTWCSGGTLVVVSPELRRDSAALIGFIADAGVERIFLAPVALQQLAEASAGKEVSAWLSEVIAAGESLRITPAIKTFFDSRNQATLHNHYGPAETHVVTTYELKGTPDCSVHLPPSGGTGSLPPIGRPITASRVHLLNSRLSPVPLGVAGELFIGGGSLARGYLHRAGLSAEKFIPDPLGPAHGAKQGARLYKTGDLARRLPDGNIEFLDRIDHQVKVRGFRVEPGEIETVLGEHPSVRKAVVIARQAPVRQAAGDLPGPTRLVAYALAERSDSAMVRELRDFLSSRLPRFMVPAALVLLDSFPLTPSGKIDRGSLPEPEAVRREAEASHVAPRSPVEEALVEIWGDVLGLAEISVDDNFFDLGGHSLLATQVVSRVRQALQVEVPIRSLFERPTVAGLARCLGLSGIATPPLRRLARDRDLPLSFAQQRLWFLDQLLPASSVYNLPVAWRLQGELDVAALEASLRAITQRHEVLRTTFPNVGGKPRQAIAPQTVLSLPMVDLGGLSRAAPVQTSGRRAEAERLVHRETGRAFDLARGPLLRAGLLRLGDQDHVLLITLHHIVSDGWSDAVLQKELTVFYKAFSARQGSQRGPVREGAVPLNTLPELAVQYADFAAWQREWLKGEILEKQLAYWKRRLGDSLSVLRLPTDRPRPAVHSHQGAYLSLELPESLTDSLRGLSRDAGASLFMTLLAAFMTLLQRITGQRDVVVGSPIANRNRREIEELIGFFVNNLVLRGDLSANPTFRELLARIREISLGAYAHQDLPFERLVEELQPERDMAVNPLFQVSFALQNAPEFNVELPGLVVSSMELDIDTDTSAQVRLDLELHLWKVGGAMSGVFAYNTALLDATTLGRLANHLQTLLRGIVAEPERRLAALSLWTTSERHQLLVEWNDSRADRPGRCLHYLFEAQVERTPDAVAVTFDQEILTYRKLNRRANQLSHYLRSLGAFRAGSSEALVGIVAERSLEMVVGLLGILKAGGAYVPLDPSYPEDRLTFMLKDARVRLLLTQEHLIERLPIAVISTVRVVSLDGDRFLIARESEANAPSPDVDPEHPAYAIYTSGSTGRPKGVVNTHRAVVNHLLWIQENCGLRPADRVLQKTPLSFDASVSEIFWPLLNGMRLVVARPGGHRDSAYLVEVIVEQGITMLQVVPSMLQAFVEQPGVERCVSLRHLICGGETLSPEIRRRFCCHSSALLHNVYGPTEAAVDVTSWICGPQGSRLRVPIGRPVANTRINLLDSDLSSVPVGVPGELHLGGIQLARGYLGRPALTAERFIPDPFSDNGMRLYKTGDLARYLPDGTIEFLGRIDHQVKIRGNRIELGEIEAVLGEHQAVREVVVLVRQGRRASSCPHPQGLVAYLATCTHDTHLTEQELRENLRERLPEIMVPAWFVFLDDLPLLPNGKFDRAALAARPASEYLCAGRGTTSEPSKGPVEEILIGIWSRILGVEGIGIHDNFFELGGHSLLATQVISRVRRTFEVELPLRNLFEMPTVFELATAIEAARRTGIGAQVPALERADRDATAHGGGLDLSFAQERLWFLQQLEPDSPAYNMPNVLGLEGPLDAIALEASCREIAQRHEILRTSFPSFAGSPRQVVAPMGSLHLPIVDLEALTPPGSRRREALRVANREVARPFDLARGPLLRVALLKLGTEDHVLFVNVHHIVSDGWSSGVFNRELATLYEAFSEGRASPLVDMPIQYVDFALWQRDWLSGELLEAQLSYWRKQLDRLSQLSLPTDRPRPLVQTYPAAVESLALSESRTADLKRLSRRAGATFYMTALAAFMTLLHRYTGQVDVVVGSPIASRNREEIEGLIGFFVNMLVMRGDLSCAPDRLDPGFLEILRRVRDMALGAYAHQDLPFERLVEELDPERDMSRNPLFQVTFALQNAPGPGVDLPGLEVSMIELESEAVRFDLELYLWETDRGCELCFVYNTDLFDPTTIGRIAKQLDGLFKAIVADPHQGVSHLSAFSAGERHQLLCEWSGYLADECGSTLAHHLFERQAERIPDAVALVSAGAVSENAASAENLTYRELNKRADNLARLLRTLGVGPETRVCLCL